MLAGFFVDVQSNDSLPNERTLDNFTAVQSLAFGFPSCDRRAMTLLPSES